MSLFMDTGPSGSFQTLLKTDLLFPPPFSWLVDWFPSRSQLWRALPHVFTLLFYFSHFPFSASSFFLTCLLLLSWFDSSSTCPLPSACLSMPSQSQAFSSLQSSYPVNECVGWTGPALYIALLCVFSNSFTASAGWANNPTIPSTTSPTAHSFFGSIPLLIHQFWLHSFCLAAREHGLIRRQECG